MFVTYSESPSFSNGWCVHVDAIRKTVQVRDLERRSYLLASSRIDPFPPGSPVCQLEPEEDVFLAQLLDQVRLKVDRNAGYTLDGTLHALSINSGSSFIGVQWNSKIPRGCTGIQELVAKLKSLAEVCHNKTKQRLQDQR